MRSIIKAFGVGIAACIILYCGKGATAQFIPRQPHPFDVMPVPPFSATTMAIIEDRHNIAPGPSPSNKSRDDTWFQRVIHFNFY
jgi:hypothetical protein